MSLNAHESCTFRNKMFSLVLTTPLHEYALAHPCVSYSRLSFSPIAEFTKSHKSKFSAPNGDYFSKLSCITVNWTKTLSLEQTLPRATRFAWVSQFFPSEVRGNPGATLCSLHTFKEQKRFFWIVPFGSHPLDLSEHWLVTGFWFILFADQWLTHS